MGTNLIQSGAITPPANAPTWVLIIGACLVVITFLFLIVLVIFGKKIGLDKNNGGLIAIIVSIALALGFGLIGGYAQAEGAIPISETVNPVKFGVGGGFGVFVIVYLLLSYFWVRQLGPSMENNGEIVMMIEADMTLRDAIEAAATLAGRTVAYSPDSPRFDQLLLREGELKAKPVEHFIELLSLRVTNGTITYTVKKMADSNVIKITNVDAV